ncbi:hypothetical protein GCM10025789_15690 [Tessaracoccus lubricantis]|uniref:Helix-turn-helix domain-containing protein n=2 Tax=Propionibacteriaceae TaxID=31957 RepID=A0ABP9FBG6_9ACTN
MRHTKGTAPMPAPLLYTVKEAASLLSIGRTRVYELLNQGSLEKVKIGNSTRIPADALQTFLDALRHTTH